MAEGQTFDNSNHSPHNHRTSIEYYDKRLTIAKECHDQLGQRCAHANLGHAYLYLEDFDKAVYHYRKALMIAETIGDDLFIAQISFILGCVYNIKQDYKSAIDFHEKHSNLAQQFQDARGRCHAYLILSQLYDKTNQYDKGKTYFNLHTTLAREIEASNGIKSGTKNKLTKNLRAESISISLSELHIPHSLRSHSAIPGNLIDDTSTTTRNKKPKLGFMQHFNKKSSLSIQKQLSPADPDDLVDLVHRMQTSRFDDQRCEIKKRNASQTDLHERRTSAHLEDILNTIDRLQQFRLDDQRTTFPSPRNHTKNQHVSAVNEKFFDQLAKCQNSRMNDQRAVLLPSSPSTSRSVSTSTAISSNSTPPNAFFNETTSKTLPDEEFCSLLSRLQSRYTDQQRICSSSSSKRILPK